MAPRRGRSTKTQNAKDYNNLTIDDALCPICRSVLVEPVTLPCNHDLCYTCFDGTMRNANLACPLCRVRIGSWLRIKRKENKLVNQELWNVIRQKFPKQLENRSKGIDEDVALSEVHISLATPGEIGREFELQRRKEEELIRKQREQELKASEKFINKLKQEELEYQEAVKEEQLKKLKLDEEVAKKLSHEWAKKSVLSNKKGPIDKFVRKKDETVVSNKAENSVNNALWNFANKEYTCRVLCLNKDNNQPSTSKSSDSSPYLPVIRKKNKQLQKIFDLEASSDSSDCIESECRYFKPIDYRCNPPSERTSPIKIPTRRAIRNVAAKILSPSGEINFKSNILESAFARISITLREDTTALKSAKPSSPVKTTKSEHSQLANSKNFPSKRKAIGSEPSNYSQAKKKKMQEEANSTKRELFKFSNDTSVPFYGFENDKAKKKEENAKILQEKADYEFAKKLQDELNRNSQYTTRSQISSNRRSRRQITLDEIVTNTYKVK